MGTTRVLILPGLYDSGPTHWQTLWERKYPAFRRVAQREWNTPDRDEWVATLERAVRDAGAPVVLVAHSLACALVAHWARAGSTDLVAAALLVAPADVESEAHTPPEARGFAPFPTDPLPFRTVVVASGDDPYMELERTRHFARSWGARIVEVGDKGHINVASGNGPWPEGERLLEELLEGR